MEAYVLGVVLGAFAIVLVALIPTTMHPRRRPGPRGPAESSMEAARADDAGGTPSDRAGQPPRALRLVRPTPRLARSTGSTTDWLLRVVPGACAATAVTLVVVTFAAQNTREVRLDFLDWHLDRVPVAAAILAAVILPASIVAVLAFRERRRLRRTIRRLERRLRGAGDWHRPPERDTRLRRASGSRLGRPRRPGRLGGGA
jgi:uncharacterized integral membrane protein